MADAALIAKLGKCRIFEDLSEEELLRVAKRMDEDHFPPGDQILKVNPRQGFPAGEVKMKNPQVPGFSKNAQPIASRDFRPSPNHLQRVRTINTVQRTAMRDLCNQRQWVRNHQKEKFSVTLG